MDQQESFKWGIYFGGYIFNVLIFYYFLRREVPLVEMSVAEDFFCLIIALIFALLWPAYFSLFCIIVIPTKIMFYLTGLWKFVVALFYYILDFKYKSKPAS